MYPPERVNAKKRKIKKKKGLNYSQLLVYRNVKKKRPMRACSALLALEAFLKDVTQFQFTDFA